MISIKNDCIVCTLFDFVFLKCCRSLPSSPCGQLPSGHTSPHTICRSDHSTDLASTVYPSSPRRRIQIPSEAAFRRINQQDIIQHDVNLGKPLSVITSHEGPGSSPADQHTPKQLRPQTPSMPFSSVQQISEHSCPPSCPPSDVMKASPGSQEDLTMQQSESLNSCKNKENDNVEAMSRSRSSSIDDGNPSFADIKQCMDVAAVELTHICLMVS